LRLRRIQHTINANEYLPNHSRDHADSEYVSYVAVDRNGSKFIGNKQTHSHKKHIGLQTLNFMCLVQKIEEEKRRCH